MYLSFKMLIEGNDSKSDANVFLMKIFDGPGA